MTKTQHNGENTRQRIVAFILQFKAAYGHLPQQYQIAQGIGISYSGVCYQLQILEQLGFVAKQPTLRPTWAVLKEDEQQRYTRPAKTRRKPASGEQLFRHAQQVFGLPTSNFPPLSARVTVFPPNP